MPTEAQRKAEEFLRVSRDFRLGSLPTEQRHPQTQDLARLSRENLPEAIRLLAAIDRGVVAAVAAKQPELTRLVKAIGETFARGKRVFFYGCGATGRLSLSVEHIWRFLHQGRPEADWVMGFMSGGDLALVHSIENFEDHPEFGARQIREIGFQEGDLLVSCTEGGETPSVIGATEEACRLSSVKPYFLYCNPDEVLRREVARSRHVLENPGIEKICLFVGNMSLSGSTRLQASTALQMAAGWALAQNARVPAPALEMAALLDFLKGTDFSFLAPFAQKESEIYQEGDYLLYETSRYGITVLTDTTERAPTFSLLGFENQKNPARRPSLSYLCLPHAHTTTDAWREILLRDPIALEWDELDGVASASRLEGFDFSRAARGQREKLAAPAKMRTFSIDRAGDLLCFELGGLTHEINVGPLHPLFEHLFLKMLLNMHSTLVMGRMGRFESNVMTWVRPSNNKLIDRSVRYVQHLLLHRGVEAPSYEEITRQCFEEIEKLGPNESVVLKTVDAIVARKRH